MKQAFVRVSIGSPGELISRLRTWRMVSTREVSGCWDVPTEVPRKMLVALKKANM